MSRRELEQPCPEQWTHYEKTGERIVDFCKRKAKQHVKDDAPYGSRYRNSLHLIAVGEQMSFDFDQDEGE